MKEIGAMKIQIGILVFPEVQQLDLTGPYEVFATWPDARVHVIWKYKQTIISSTGLRLEPSVTFDDCPQLDAICIPGGAGINPLLLDDIVLDFICSQAHEAKYVTSVCTGALVLGAAGLLRGKRATTHWAVLDLLAAFGAVPTHGRVVRDGAVMTGGGVTAGIDFAFALIGEMADRSVAEAIQLKLEYAPQPPFNAGSPTTAPEAVLETIRIRGAPLRAERERLVRAAAEKLAAR
jgi:cyclohexyl-isocyanide hydratase